MKKLSNLALLALVAGSSLACGVGPGPLSSGCRVTYTGNYTDTVSQSSSCVTLLPPITVLGVTSGWTLQFVSTSQRAGVTLQGSIDLGSDPAPGSFSSSTVMHWQAVSLSNSNCAYVASNMATPQGNFALELTTVAGLDGLSPTVHGTLHLEQYVQAPPATPCGPGDVQTSDVQF